VWINTYHPTDDFWLRMQEVMFVYVPFRGLLGRSSGGGSCLVNLERRRMMAVMISCVQCYLYSSFMYSHHQWWYKLLLFKSLNNTNSGHTLCLFICSSIPFLLSQLYSVSGKSTQPASFPFLSLVNKMSQI
jgi:hypothetical protein